MRAKEGIPGRKMKNIQESSKRIASHISNLCFFHKRLVKKVGRILFFAFLLFFTVFFFTILFLDALLGLYYCSRDIKAHLNQFVGAGSGLLATVLGATGWLGIGIGAIGVQSEFNSNFILSRKVRVRDFGIRDFERRSVLDIKG